jgi:hypothetical protein
MVLEDEVRGEDRGQLLPVPRRRGSPDAQKLLQGAGAGRGLTRAVARVELRVRGVEVVRVEHHHRNGVAVVVDLGDLREFDLHRADPVAGALEAPPMQGEPVAPGGEHPRREP